LVHLQVHRICPAHRRSLRIVAEDGTAWRFCLQCAKLHTLDEFSGDRRSCQSSLLLRRQRKRERQLAEQEDREDSLKLRKRSSSSKKAAAAGTGTGSLPIEAPPSDASDATPVGQQTHGCGSGWEAVHGQMMHDSTSQEQLAVLLDNGLSAASSGAYWQPSPLQQPLTLRSGSFNQPPQEQQLLRPGRQAAAGVAQQQQQQQQQQAVVVVTQVPQKSPFEWQEDSAAPRNPGQQAQPYSAAQPRSVSRMSVPTPALPSPGYSGQQLSHQWRMPLLQPSSVPPAPSAHLAEEAIQLLERGASMYTGVR
jgi:hypothetical protein